MHERETPFIPLTAISPLDGRYRETLEHLVPFTSELALIKTRVEVESRYLMALSDIGLTRPLNSREQEFLTHLGQTLTIEQAHRVKEIEQTTKHDVKAVERAIREFLAGTSMEDLKETIHFGLTSEDVNNLSYRLLVDRARKEVLVPAIDMVIDELANKALQYKAMPMLARTHGQPAVPTTLGKELSVIAVRLHRQTRKLEQVILTGKLNGAVGNYNALALAAPDIDWIAFSQDFIHRLGLEPNLFTTQINPYDDLVDLFGAFERINGIILDLDQDMWRYISDDWFTQEVKAEEIGSSTMPQKVNPIHFENSEGNIEIANSMLEGMIRSLPLSRLQRDLSDSTVIRNVGVALGHSLLAYTSTIKGLQKIVPNEEAIKKALYGNWSILTEAAQILLRREGITDPYPMVAKLFRGKRLNQDEWLEWVQDLDISRGTKKILLKLTPETYIGLAKQLTELAIEEIRASR